MMRSYTIPALLGLAVMASSCLEESFRGAQGADRVEVLQARIATTRTSFDNTTGRFSWSAGDDIAVYRTVSGYETAPLTEDGCFNVHLTGSENRGGFALYPARIAKANAYEAASMQVTLPTEYTIPTAGMGEWIPLPMIAVNDPEDEDLTFHHMGGVIQLSLDAVPYETAILSVDFGKRITGDFAVSSPASGAPQIVTDDAAGEPVRFQLAIPLSAPRDGYVINVPVPTGTYESMTVRALDFKNNLLAQGSGTLADGVVGRAEGTRGTVALQTDINSLPLTIKAIWAGDVVIKNPLQRTIQYSSDNQNWTSNSDEVITIPLERSECVYLRGTNANYSDGTTYVYEEATYLTEGHYTNIQSTVPVYLYGNILSLIKGSNFQVDQNLTDANAHAFAGLFKDNPYLYWNPSFPLILPSGTIAADCFAWMFANTSITSAPALGASVMKDNCYRYMFQGCTVLTEATALNATTVAPGCYQGMFKGCTSLSTGPASLPATVLSDHCYAEMFMNSGLTTVPALSATAPTLAASCYKEMFMNTLITTVPQNYLPATTMANNCYEEMFRGCSYLENPPDLNSEALAYRCYYRMFESDERLQSCPELRATTMTEACYAAMFAYCKAITTAPALKAGTLEKNCYMQMFAYCDNLTYLYTDQNTPQYILPATEGKSGCYASMFVGCYNLETAPIIMLETFGPDSCGHMLAGCGKINSITAMFTEAPSSANSLRWVDGVAASGTFRVNAAASWYNSPDFVQEINTIPAGWTITPINVSDIITE